MTIFNLPDLGEGLPDAEIHEWYVKPGDEVEVDQPMVAMETAKAVVDIPCPQAGIIGKLYGEAGDILKTGSPLIEFISNLPRVDKGTVVGSLEESNEISDDHFIIGTSSNSTRIKATPNVKLLAKKLKVDLTKLEGLGANGFITREEVEQAANDANQPPEGYTPLKGVRRGMLNSMVQSHNEVVPVSIFDEVSISYWEKGCDITVKLISAIIHGCQQEPALNAWFDTASSAVRYFDTVNIGLAMDSNDGLFVPIIHQANTMSDMELRNKINDYKDQVTQRSIAPENLKGATITLSNFGKFSGRFASPIIVPPSVAIVAVGRVYSVVVMNDGQPVEQKHLPLSLSFDHRAVTGGEATRFLGAMIEFLKN